MKDQICAAIDSNRAAIYACGEYILQHPELGFREEKTSAYVKAAFEKLGIPYQDNLAITGVMGTIGRPDAPIHICIIGEMDAIVCHGHPHADPITGAAHACGHNAQVASMLGAAYGIVESGMLAECDCRISFLAVPAEEFVELDYRRQLVEKELLTYMSGKQELLHLGVFEDINVAMMIHAHPETPGKHLFLNGSSLGFEAKQLTFTGKAAHGSEPWNGTSALDAAVLAVMGIHANRPTFRDADRVRIHPIISNGGDLVNVIPDKAVIETYVRAANPNALRDACSKVDNAARAGALAMGAECEIENIRGYAPLQQDPVISRVFEENARMFYAENEITYGQDMTGSTDMGDVSQALPSIQPTMGGFTGALHSKEFGITDPETVYITAAKLLACTAYDLAKENGAAAKEIKNTFSKELK
jgi:amidohydrolase